MELIFMIVVFIIFLAFIYQINKKKPKNDSRTEPMNEKERYW